MHCLCLKTFALYGSLHYIELRYKDLLLYIKILNANYINFENFMFCILTLFYKMLCFIYCYTFFFIISNGRVNTRPLCHKKKIQ